MLTFFAETLHDFEWTTAHEWLETNGLGGWASSSLCFAGTRRYHGMLVAASRTRAERSVIVSKLDETAAGIELGCNRFPGVIHPRGFEHLLRFDRALFPVWEYALPSGRLRKTVVCP